MYTLKSETFICPIAHCNIQTCIQSVVGIAVHSKKAPFSRFEFSELCLVKFMAGVVGHLKCMAHINHRLKLLSQHNWGVCGANVILYPLSLGVDYLPRGSIILIVRKYS